VSVTESPLSRRLTILSRAAAPCCGAGATRYLLAIEVPVAPAVIAGVVVLTLAWLFFKIGGSDLPTAYVPPGSGRASFGPPLRKIDLSRSGVCFAFAFSWVTFMAPFSWHARGSVASDIAVYPAALLSVAGLAIIIWRKAFSFWTD